MIREHLTRPDPVFEQAVAETPAGMAFWAGTGPAGQACSGCSHWRMSGRDEHGELKDSTCAEYRRQIRAAMAGRNGVRIPADTASCKYFQPASERSLKARARK